MPKRQLSCRILLAGPPAAGKTSIARAFLEQTDGVRHFPLDEDIQLMCAGRGHTGRLTDEFIDEAVSALLNRSRDLPGLIELAHHDYVGLISRGILKLGEFDLILIVEADYPELEQREKKRARDVPLDYIARCLGATAALRALAARFSESSLIFNTMITPPEQVALCAIDYLRQDSSQSLARIEVAPATDRPYLGGSLRDQVEWDTKLVGELLRRYSVRTALDVGCGSGGTIPKFGEFGIEAWGVDGLVREGPASHRTMAVDFTRQWIEWPSRFDLVWCVEVLEHVAQRFEHNLVRTIAANTGSVAFVTAAPPGQPGYHHVNCQPQSYWIERFGAAGLRYVDATPEILAPLSDVGPFGMNVFKSNGMLFEVTK